jgi:hypothetical protein
VPRAQCAEQCPLLSKADFFNSIGRKQTFLASRQRARMRTQALAVLVVATRQLISQAINKMKTPAPRVNATCSSMKPIPTE